MEERVPISVVGENHLKTRVCSDVVWFIEECFRVRKLHSLLLNIHIDWAKNNNWMGL